MLDRFEKVNEVTAYLLRRGKTIISPISMMHPVSQYGLPKDWDFWSKVDKNFITISTSVLVLKLKGWESSTGVNAEIEYAKKQGKQVDFMGYEDIFNQ